jgi:RHS repeat-associated protein
MEGRSYSDSTYRYGFNGKEKDKAFNAKGTNYDFGARIYNPAMGRWLSIDPAFHEYPGYSGYNFVLNSPIASYDADGKRTYFAPGLGGRTTGKVYVESIVRAFSSFLGDAFVEIKTGNTPNAFSRFLAKAFGNKIGPLKNPTYSSDMLYAASRSARKPALPILKDIHIRNTVREIENDLNKNPLKDGENFNLIGLSMGSINAAQAAIVLLRRGTVDRIDNLILGGSPINLESRLYRKLLKLQSEGKIGNISYEPLPGDAITGVAGKNLLDMIPRAKEMVNQMNTQGPDQIHEKASNDPTLGDKIAERSLGDNAIEGEEVSKRVKEKYKQE